MLGLVRILVGADPVSDPITTFTGFGVAGAVMVLLWIRGNEYKADRDHFREVAEKVVPAFILQGETMNRLLDALRTADDNAKELKSLLETMPDKATAALMTKAYEDMLRALERKEGR